MRRAVAFAAVLSALLAVAPAAQASSTIPAPKGLNGGLATVAPCGGLSGITLSWNISSGIVTSVNVAGVPAGCVGSTVSLTLYGVGGTALGTVSPVTISATTQTLSLASGSPTASAVTASAISAVGP